MSANLPFTTANASTETSSLNHDDEKVAPPHLAAENPPREEVDEKQDREGGAPDKPDADDDDDARTITGIRWFLICIALYVSALMYGLDTTIAADVQGAVIGTFPDVAQLAWIGAGFPLGSVAVILPYGFLFTAFNMKWYVSSFGF